MNPREKLVEHIKDHFEELLFISGIRDLDEFSTFLYRIVDEYSDELYSEAEREAEIQWNRIPLLLS